MGFGQRLVDTRDIADAKGDGKGIKLLVGKGERLGIADEKPARAAKPAWRRRSLPTSSMAGLISHRVALQPGPPPRSAFSATSPVPAATSISSKGRCDRGGFSQVMRSSFQSRCRPADIRSFMRS